MSKTPTEADRRSPTILVHKLIKPRSRPLTGWPHTSVYPAGKHYPLRTYGCSPMLRVKESRRPEIIMDNPSSPVSRLPLELLVKVFGYLTIHSSPVILLKICHRWADIASSVSSLWTRIDFSTPPAPLLQRCASRPIEVILRSSSVVPTSNRLDAAKEVLLLYNDRIRKVVLDLPDRHLHGFEAELSGVFPILADVSISVSDDDDYLFFPDIPEWRPAAIPPSPIRRLKLMHVKALWVPGRFQNLVEFFLHNQLYPDFDLTMEVFLGILESSPQLAILSVAAAGPRLPPDSINLPPATRVVHLHNLRHLYLEQGDPCDIGWILVHLKVPISTNVKIFVNSGRGESAVPLDLVFDLALPNHHGFPHLINLHRCTYTMGIRPSCVITAPNFAFGITWDIFPNTHFDDFMMPFLRRAMTVGVIEDLTVIHAQPEQYCSTSTLQWNQLFSTLHSLRKLRVEESCNSPDLMLWPLFESLSSFVLRDLRLSLLVFGDEPQGDVEDGHQKELTERVVKWCAERNRRGCRLNSLVIEDPMHFPLGLTSLLVPYVDNLEVTEEPFGGKGVLDPGFGSRHVFDHL